MADIYSEHQNAESIDELRAINRSIISLKSELSGCAKWLSWIFFLLLIVLVAFPIVGAAVYCAMR